jgi:hypothetical protein
VSTQPSAVLANACCIAMRKAIFSWQMHELFDSCSNCRTHAYSQTLSTASVRCCCCKPSLLVEEALLLCMQVQTYQQQHSAHMPRMRMVHYVFFCACKQAEQMMNDPEFKDEIQRYMASLRTVSASTCSSTIQYSSVVIAACSVQQ